MVFEVVVDLPDVNDPRRRQKIDQPLLRDGDAGGNMDDLSLLDLVEVDIRRLCGKRLLCGGIVGASATRVEAGRVEWGFEAAFDCSLERPGPAQPSARNRNTTISDEKR
ncbi:MAG: hypothetical protein MPW14_13200 [Candidatus Manganitrophus sp.]|nr:hypothetical protein [Candidatus Manganitrophus sp.]WDT78178.1 MAG: hypothetical protein MPW14_13200 [Candidatus Manganitrophus sp.]